MSSSKVSQVVKVKSLSHGLNGTLFFPGDKSLSHRAIIFGALSEGSSTFSNILPGEDCLCTRGAFESMGIKIETHTPTKWTIHGKGLRGLEQSKTPLDCGNSGTSMRLLSGVFSGFPFETTLTGDPSLSSRPMRRVTDYLKQMGAVIEGKDNANYAPLKIKGGSLKGISAKLAISSAQVKSAILLAGLFAKGQTQVTEPVKSRDHTERFLAFFGAKIQEDGLTVTLPENQSLQARNFEIAGDISSAAFFMAGALLVPNSEIHFKSVLWNPTRTGIIEIIKRMGVDIQMDALHKDGPELAADFTIVSQPIKAFEIQREELPSLIDEIPILMVLATQAKGTSIIHEADELRVKETDRIHSMTSTLTKMGAKIRVEGNTIFIDGPTKLQGAKMDSFKDHRTAMSLIMAGLCAVGETTVTDTACINTSFPNFFDLLTQVKGQYSLG